MGTAIVAFACYSATLLPGLDFGDSASFQTGVGSLTLTPRQAYPLYYALGNIFAWLDPREAAHAMNLASAVYGALAVAVATWLAAELAASTLAGVSAGLFLAFSYTFWSQAITAEVYTLHLLIVGATLVTLLRWENRPTTARLALFYAFYAAGFGNHLSMILMLPALVLFLFIARRPGDGDPLTVRAIGMAVALAVAGALQYAWNFRALWWELEPPENLGAAFGKFWFDVTKSDWRETLVMGVSESGLQSRPAMYWWDLRQQFGAPGIVLAVIGFGYLVVRSPRRAVLLGVLYLAALTFAWTYNVGDAYIFFLPSHYVIALCAGAGVAALMSLARLFPAPVSLFPLPSSLFPLPSSLFPVTVAILCLAYPAWRGYDDFPALDRSWDTRAVQMFDQLTSPPSTQSSSCTARVFGLDANWQVQNASEYYMREHKPGIPWFVTQDFKWLDQEHRGTFARFLDANSNTTEGTGRDIVVTADALRAILKSNSSVSRPTRSDPGRTLADAIPRTTGLVYVLAVLRPNTEFPIDRAELALAWHSLTTADTQLPALKDYTVIIGRVGERPELIEASNRPFRVRTTAGTLHLDVRMEAWLPTDTIRRSGFGHVIANSTHVLSIDRGVSLVMLASSGEPVLTEYRSGLFAPIPRWVFLPGDGVSTPCYR